MHAIKNGILIDYTGVFGRTGSMMIGEMEKKTFIRFENVEDFEKYFNAIGFECASEDIILTGSLYKLNTPQFNRVERAQFGRGTDFEHDVFDSIVKNCYIPTSGHCFINYINQLAAKNYTEDFLTFIRTQQRRSHAITTGRIRPFCKKHNIILDCYNGFRVCR